VGVKLKLKEIDHKMHRHECWQESPATLSSFLGTTYKAIEWRKRPDDCV